MQQKLPEVKKSILVINKQNNNDAPVVEGGEETEITAQVSVPQDGGWGWVVVGAAFINVLIVDGINFTFGSLLPDLAKDLNYSDSLIALVNSVSIGLYLFCAPLASALINRFGFRVTVMCGSAISSFSFFIAHFAPSYAYFFVFYGVFAGFGNCLINMANGLVVGFYFEKYRSIAIAVVSSGTSVGIMTIFPLNVHLVELAGWRPTTLLHSGMIGFVYFLAFTFRPLLSLSVVMTTDNEPTKTTAYLPSMANITEQNRMKQEFILKPTVTEKLFNAVGNVNFPTAAAVVDEGTKIVSAQTTPSPAQPGTSGAPGGVSRLTITANNPQGGLSRRQIQQVQSIASRTNQQDGKQNTTVVSGLTQPEVKERGFWKRFFSWESHVPESRPMYRDDAFYQGNIEKLSQYQKSVMETPAGDRTGIEYQLAVSRAAATADIKDRRGVFTTAARRVLATMMDPTLLKRKDFVLSCASGFLVCLGYLVPFVYLKERNLRQGIASSHCSLFVSTIGMSNFIGRFVLGALAVKIDSIYLLIITLSLAGISTMLSMLSFSLLYQYAYCAIFGFFVAGASPLRSISLVEMLGLDKLTNGMGILLLFQGLASAFSTPLAGAIKNSFGYTISFVVAGCFITLSGLVLIPTKFLSKVSDKKKTKDNKALPKYYCILKLNFPL